MADNNPRPRIFYVDNLRIFLTALVVLHHFAITYGAPGGWFYNESSAEFPEVIPLSMFVATNQAFFMGMFFFISAYFIVSSIKRKGVSKFSKDRLTRLGIPILLFYFFLFPVTIYIRDNYLMDRPVELWELIRSGVFGFGPMWFVEALLIFTFTYLILTKSRKKGNDHLALAFPGTIKILITAVIIGILQFIIRIWLPVGWAMPFTEFQFPHFVQYIVLFSFGIVAFRNNWLDDITAKMGWRWFVFVNALILLVFPILFILGGAAENGPDAFMGGLTLHSFSYCIWEQLVGFTMIIALFGIFKSKLNAQGKMAKKMSEGAYAVYVIHTPVIVGVSAVFLSFDIPQFWKFVVLSPVALTVCFSMAFLIKRTPILKNIF